VARCLEPLPENRFSSADEIIDKLDGQRKWRVAVPAIAAVAVIAAVMVGAVTYNVNSRLENVRLAVLPFETDAGNRAFTDGLVDDASKRLRRVKGRSIRFTVIPLSDAVQNRVDGPEKAARLLGATHILTGSMRWNGGRALVQALLSDARTHLPLRQWSGEYQAEKLRDMAIALAGMVTGALQLPPLAVAVTVNTGAYADFTSGVGLLQRNAVDGALPLLERAVKADPDSPLTHARLAEAQILKYQLTNDATWLNRAIMSFGNARQRNPDAAEVWFVSGMINESAGAYERARDDVRRGLEIEPENGDGWRYLGRVYQKSNRLTDALAAYQKGVAVQPGHFKNYQGLCSLYSDLGNYQEGIPLCLKLVALAPDFPAAHLQLAVAYGNWGRYVEAENEAREALKLSPGSVLAFQVLATILAYQGRYTESVSYSQQAIDSGYSTHLIYLNLGATLRWAKLPDEAGDAFRKGVTLAEAELAKNSLDGRIRARLAYMCALLHERSRAENEAALAQQNSAGSVEVDRYLVMTYEALGERDQALAVAQRAPEEALRRLSRSPDMANLREDSRFQVLMKSNHIY
jgi:tetratricopeptide (TPR) repeat protein/TolB-like protein